MFEYITEDQRQLFHAIGRKAAHRFSLVDDDPSLFMWASRKTANELLAALESAGFALDIANSKTGEVCKAWWLGIATGLGMNEEMANALFAQYLAGAVCHSRLAWPQKRGIS